ncbi:hypothetical protein ABWH89_09435 [Hoeflea alexandrii]|uniref:hypothetical protein n=1 Tax=Hoeflea alexandrii TaxID=288436 RepID=UPI0035D04B51
MDGDILTKEQKRDIFLRNRNLLDTVYLIGPDAAGAVLEAYRAGQLPMGRGESVQVAPQAEQYLENADSLREQIAERQRKEACVKDISLVEERDFSDSRLLNRIFFENSPKGQGTLKLAGINVTKTVHGYRSNSGKNTGYDVSFHWTGSDGQPASSGTGKPPEAFNRRNDEERNWGLPE